MKLLRLVWRSSAARASTAFWAGRKRSWTLVVFKEDAVFGLVLRMVDLTSSPVHPTVLYSQCPYNDASVTFRAGGRGINQTADRIIGPISAAPRRRPARIALATSAAPDQRQLAALAPRIAFRSFQTRQADLLTRRRISVSYDCPS